MRCLTMTAAAGALVLAVAAATPAHSQDWENQGGTGGAAGHAAPNPSDPSGSGVPSADSYGAPEPMNAPPPMDSDRSAAPSAIAPPPAPEKDPEHKE